MSTRHSDLHETSPASVEMPAASTFALHDQAMANKPDPLGTAYARIAKLEGLLREAEAYCPIRFTDGPPLLANRIQEALRKQTEEVT